MKKSGRFLFLGVLLCLGFSPVRASWATRVNTDPSRVRIQLSSMVDGLPHKGYVPIRIQIENTGSTGATWTFDFRSTLNWQDQDVLNYATRVSLQAGEERILEVMVPLYPIREGMRGHSIQPRLRVNILGPGLEAQSHQLLSTGQSGTGEVLGLTSTLVGRNKSAIEQRFQSRGGMQGRVLSAGLSQFPEDIRGLSGLDFLLITPDEWAALERGSQYLLMQWIGRGGHLLLAGPADASLPAAFQPYRGGGNAAYLGWGSVTPVLMTGDTLDPDDLVSLMAQIQRDRPAPGKGAFDARAWQLRDLIPDVERPVVLLLMAVIAIAILLGPINVVVAFRRKRPVQLLWMTPLLSVSLSLVLILLILLMDGFGGKGHRAVTVFLLPAENLEIVSQEQVSRTGVLMRRSFSLPVTAMILPLRIDHSSGRGSQGSYSAAPGGQWDGDWFESRAIQGQAMIDSRPSRARLEFIPASGNAPPEVLSSIDAELASVILRDFDGNYWRTENIRPGSRAPLTPATPEEGQALIRSLSLRDGERVLPVTGPGVFLAQVAEGSGVFMESLDSIRWDRQAARYTGFLVRGGGQ
ncbi:MAG: hypothetical protein JJU29_02245 [Verrucomicrobia bacterium]|nr:hypothetical protein [Verrucomicrobiota bacterium]MCH8513360.1 hypothetical protein [Kiritimatiellia bacterium]